MRGTQVASTRRLRIGVDLDGVCYDFVDALRRWGHKVTGRPLEEFGPATHWGFYEDWKWSEQEFLQHYRDALTAGFMFRDGPIFFDALMGLRKLRALGHRIDIMTDRGLPGILDVAETSTKHWLKENDVPFDSLYIGRNKTLVPVDICIEDSVKHYEALLRGGSNPRMLTRPWNRGYDAIRVSDWAGFLEEVDQLAAQRVSPPLMPRSGLCRPCR
jgi:5'(3')-deoxyribonucleotidase